MKREIARQLKEKINECEKQFSNPQREYNHNNETYKCTSIKPLSETTALITFKKNTGKKSIALFFYIKKYWIYFFPTDSHELGMYNYLHNKYRINLEINNFPRNFKDQELIETIEMIK